MINNLIYSGQLCNLDHREKNKSISESLHQYYSHIIYILVVHEGICRQLFRCPK